MKFGKFVSGALCLSMLMGLFVPVSAAENDLYLSYSKNSTFEIIIPDSASLDSETGKGVVALGVSNLDILGNEIVNISLSSENYANGSWTLVNSEDESKNVSYSIGLSDGKNDFKSGDNIISTDSETEVHLYFSLNEEARAGVYEDVLTFTSEVKKELSAGIYDENYTMLASWDELEAKGMDVSRYSPEYEIGKDSGDYNPAHPVNILNEYYPATKVLVIADTVETIGYGAFYGFGLTEVIIPGSVKRISDYSFSGNNLKKLVLKEGVAYASDNAFDSAIMEGANMQLVFPESFKPEVWSFISNPGLTSLVIKNTENYVPHQAFYNCTNLEYIYFAGTEAEWNNITNDMEEWDTENIGSNTSAGMVTIVFNYNS